MDPDKYIKPYHFCEVVSDKFVEQGVKRGHRVFVVGARALPVSEEDPYTQRIKFFVHTMDNDHVVFGPLYVMDPDSLARISENEQNYLTSVLEEDVGKVGEDAPTTN